MVPPPFNKGLAALTLPDGDTPVETGKRRDLDLDLDDDGDDKEEPWAKGFPKDARPLPLLEVLVKNRGCRSECESGLEFALLRKFDVAVTTAIVVAPVCRSCCSTSSASVTFLL
jgi:hypothetical protein